MDVPLGLGVPGGMIWGLSQKTIWTPRETIATLQSVSVDKQSIFPSRNYRKKMLLSGAMQQQQPVSLQRQRCSVAAHHPGTAVVVLGRRQQQQQQRHRAARHVGSFGFGTSVGPSSSSGDWLVPETLLPTGKPAEQVGLQQLLLHVCMHAQPEGTRDGPC